MEREKNDSGGVFKTEEIYIAFFRKVIRYHEQGRLTDVYITCRDAREFKCHRVVLATASEYFENVFSRIKRENRADVIHEYLPDVDGATFELVVQFAYKGSVIVDGENVYSLLYVCHILGMPALEGLCVRYLTEREIPIEYALDIFSFACATRKELLTPPVGRFILDHLEHFQTDTNGLASIAIDHLKTLLTFWRPSSLRREHILLKVLVHWVSKSVLNERGKKLFYGFLRRLPLFLRIPKDFIAQSIQSAHDTDLHVTPKLQLDVRSSPSKTVSLHMYVRNSNSCDLVTLKTFKNGIDWCPPMKIGNRVSDMKTVAVDDRLYSYSLNPGCGDRKKVAFSVYSSVLLAGKQSLEVPTDLLDDPCEEYDPEELDTVHICSDPTTSRIYLHHDITSPNMTTNLFSFNCEIGRWFPITCDTDDLKVSTMTYFDGRLYVIGARRKMVQAYDRRVRRWEVLANTKRAHGIYDKSCCHKGKIYVSYEMKRKDKVDAYQVMLEVYDPVAEKWNILTPAPVQPISLAGWMMSYENELWMFGDSEQDTYARVNYHHYYVQRYDSFLQKWGAGYTPLKEKGQSIIDVTISGSR